MRFFTVALLLALGSALQARESVAFFGLSSEEDPLLASYFSDRVYWGMSTDSVLDPVPPQRWKPMEEAMQSPREAWRLEQYRELAKEAGARYFVLAQREPFRYASKRIWWKPWELKVRTFSPLHLKIYAAEGQGDSAVYDGTVAYEDSVTRITPWSYEPPPLRDDPVAYDRWQREAYANMVGPTVRGIRSAITGKPLPSAVFVAEPEDPKKAKKK